MDTITDVKLFHETFNHPVADSPIVIDSGRLNTRLDWIYSEIRELKLAQANNDIVEIADALADIQYFLTGTIIEYGLGNLLPRIFAEVQRSNMSKSCSSREEANRTIQKYAEEGVESYFLKKKLFDEEGNPFIRFIIVRTFDNKTLKSINWSPPDLSFIKEYIK